MNKQKRLKLLYSIPPEYAISVYCSSGEQTSMLHRIVKQNDIKTLHKLKDYGYLSLDTYPQNGFYIDQSGDDRVTPLMLACELGFFEVASFLIENGAYCGASDMDCTNMISYACEGKNPAVVQLIYDNQDLEYSNWRKESDIWLSPVYDFSDVFKYKIILNQMFVARRRCCHVCTTTALSLRKILGHNVANLIATIIWKSRYKDFWYEN